MARGAGRARVAWWVWRNVADHHAPFMPGPALAMVLVVEAARREPRIVIAGENLTLGRDRDVGLGPCLGAGCFRAS